MKTLRLTLLMLAPLFVGCQTGKISYEGGGMPPAAEVERDDQDRITLKREFQPDGSVRSETEYTYDKLGNLSLEKKTVPRKDGGKLVSEITHSPNSDVKMQTVREYNPAGEVLSVEHFSNQPKKIGKMVPEE